MTASDLGSRRVQSSGSFELPLPAADAFTLFTAKGECRWVPGWSPDLLGEPPQHPGLVFLTSEGRTIWTVIESDARLLRHCYSRVTPGHSAGTVEVRIEPAAKGCRVDFSYDLTSLAADHAAILGPYRGSAFAAMMAEWQARICAMLRNQADPIPA